MALARRTAALGPGLVDDLGAEDERLAAGGSTALLVFGVSSTLCHSLLIIESVTSEGSARLP